MEVDVTVYRAVGCRSCVSLVRRAETFESQFKMSTRRRGGGEAMFLVAGLNVNS